MLSLLDLISQNQPQFQTQQALLVVGLQNDFIQPNGRLPVDLSTGFLERIQSLVPKFRERSTNIIWTQTLYQADRLANDPSTGEGDAVVVGGLLLESNGAESSTDDDEDPPKEELAPTPSRSSRRKQRALNLLKKVSSRRQPAPVKSTQVTPCAPEPPEEDDELFLLRTPKRAPACVPDTAGAQFTDAIKECMKPADTRLQSSNYSAFQGTNLLMLLRTKLITELYICGCITNVSVLATVIDAARHGITINLVTDCLGYRLRHRHEEALTTMVRSLNANTVTSHEALHGSHQNDQGGDEPYYNDVADALGARIGELRLQDDGRPSSAASQNSHSRGSGIRNGRPRTPSDASYAESRQTPDTKLSDEQFAEKLSQGAVLSNGNEASPAAQKMVKSKVRMRRRSNKEKKTRKSENSKEPEHEAQEVADTALSRDMRTPSESVDRPPRPSPIAKAESSDNLTKRTSKRESFLKSSVSQPSLSDTKDKDPGAKPQLSRMRLVLIRSPKSDSTKSATPQPPSPANINVTESPSKPSAKIPVASPSNISENPASKSMSPSPQSATPSGKAPSKSKKPDSLATFPILGPNDHIGEGDSRIIYDFFPSDLTHCTDRSQPLKDLIFKQMYNEVRWQKMFHQQGEVPRLVCCQGEFGADGSMPIYRHPTDQALPLLRFSPKVQLIRKQAEKLVGHPLNHVLIQLYRSGNDYISEHSDKTLDIVRGSSIVNVSFGAQRTMRLRTKKSTKPDGGPQDGEQRITQRIPMPHNSMFVLGLKSNRKWLHGIQPDKRLVAERTPEETAYSGMRISLTFRHIGTFLDPSGSTIWGQGASEKDQRDAAEVVNNDEAENEKMVRAFSSENHDPSFDWDREYGDGFDVLHFRNAPPDLPLLFASHNPVETRTVQIMLAELGRQYTLIPPPDLTSPYDSHRQVLFRDNDPLHTEVTVTIPILLYLDRYYPLDKSDRGRLCLAAAMDVFLFTAALNKAWSNRQTPGSYSEFVSLIEELEERVVAWGGPWIGGRRFAAGDCAGWAAIDEFINNWVEWSEERFPVLTEYYRMVWGRKGWAKELRPEFPKIRKALKDGVDEEGSGTLFCDYCDVYLTHDSMSVRKAHNAGRNHLRNVQQYYEQISSDQTQQVINSITDAYSAEGQAVPQMGGGPMGGFGAPGFPPHGFPPPGMPGMPPPPFLQGGRGGPMPNMPPNMPPFPPPNMPGGPPAPGGPMPPNMPPFPPPNMPGAPGAMPFPPPFPPGPAGSPPGGLPFPPPGAMPPGPPGGRGFPPFPPNNGPPGGPPGRL